PRSSGCRTLEKTGQPRQPAADPAIGARRGGDVAPQQLADWPCQRSRYWRTALQQTRISAEVRLFTVIGRSVDAQGRTTAKPAKCRRTPPFDGGALPSNGSRHPPGPGLPCSCLLNLVHHRL